MIYMNDIKQRNFRLPKELIKNWDKFNPPGSKEKSRNASGALLLYMFMPVHFRDIARKLAYKDNLDNVQQQFWQEIQQYYDDAEKAKAILDAAQAHEVKIHKKKSDRVIKSH